MNSFSKYLEEIKKDNCKLTDFYCEVEHLLNEVKTHDYHHYKHFMCELHKILYGWHFNEEMACKAVADMCNIDGTKGAHWTLNDTNNFADQYKVNRYDFYYVMNMLYSDFSTVLNSSNADLYAKLANAYINDKDAEEGKAFKLYMAGRD